MGNFFMKSHYAFNRLAPNIRTLDRHSKIGRTVPPKRRSEINTELSEKVSTKASSQK